MSALKDVRDSIPRLAEEYLHHTREAAVARRAHDDHQRAVEAREPLLRALGVDVDGLRREALREVVAPAAAVAPTQPAPAVDDEAQPDLPLDAPLPPPAAVPAEAAALEADDARMRRAVARVVSWMEEQGLAIVERDTPTLCIATGITDVSPRGLSRRLAAMARGTVSHGRLEVERLPQADPLAHDPQVWRLTLDTAEGAR